MKAVLLAISFLALSLPAFADTRNSNNDKATMEKNTSPSAPKHQQEEQTEAHSQPNSPNPGGVGHGAKSGNEKAKKKSSSKKNRESSSSGSSRPAARLDADGELAFKKLDLDGDGAISKAEAAGNSQVVNAFDRADRNHDGKLSRAEYARAVAPKRQASR